MRSLKRMETKKGAMEVFSTLCAFSCVTVRPSDRLDSRGSAGAAPRPWGALLGEHRSGDHLRPALQRSHRWDLCSALPRARPGHVWPRPQQLRHLWHHAGGGRSRAWDPQSRTHTRPGAHLERQNRGVRTGNTHNVYKTPTPCCFFLSGGHCVSNVIDVFVLNFIYKLFWHQKVKKRLKTSMNFLQCFVSNLFVITHQVRWKSVFFSKFTHKSNMKASFNLQSLIFHTVLIFKLVKISILASLFRNWSWY